MWQIEFTDQVTWCSTHTRTNPAQNNAGTAPHHDHVMRPPSRAGRANGSSDHSGNRLLTLRMAGSLRRSGAKRSALLRSRLTTQPMWACPNPLAMAHGDVPNSHGECGSPSLSEKAWCRRWSATQVMTGPCRAMLPAMAITTRSHGLALNDPWVKWRWYATVIPSPVTA